MPVQTRPTAGDSTWFVRDRFGMFIHWGLYALPSRNEWYKSIEEVPDSEYQKHFNHFYPDLYDPRAWARTAREAGMKYFVVTTKHHEGFCLWDSQYTDYKATNTPWGKDLLKPMVEAFRGEGLRVGFYHSLIDWHHPEFTVDSRHPMRNSADERAKNKDRDMKKYAEYVRNQVRELLTDFGKIDILWLDYSYPGEDGKGRDDWESEKLYGLVRELAPGILLNNRLDLPDSADFVTPEQYQPAGWMRHEDGSYAVWEACQTFSGSWGYNRDEATWKDVHTLIMMLADGVGKGGNLLLNVGPTGRGEFDYRAMERLKGIGGWMKHHGRSIYGCTAAPEDITCPQDCRLTYNPDAGRLYVHILSWPLKRIIMPGLAGRLKYAQFLHDASEVRFQEAKGEPSTGHTRFNLSEGTVTFEVPAAPPVEVPVIEIFLK